MLAAAIVQDLLTIAVELQHQPIPTLVLVDEFSAVASGGVVRLFGRGRSAGLSLLLETQELADLRPPDNPTLADQVLGNVSSLIAHRQVVPASAETLAGVIGTRGAWMHTERTETFLGAGAPTGEGTRTRTREFIVQPRHHQAPGDRPRRRDQPRPRWGADRAHEPPWGRPMTHSQNAETTVPRLDTPLLTPAEAAQLLAVKPSHRSRDHRDSRAGGRRFTDLR
jgi:hypothetical protein